MSRYLATTILALAAAALSAAEVAVTPGQPDSAPAAHRVRP